MSQDLAKELRALISSWPLPANLVQKCVDDLVAFLRARSRQTQYLCRHVVEVAQELLDALELKDYSYQLDQEASELQTAIDILRARLGNQPYRSAGTMTASPTGLLK